MPKRPEFVNPPSASPLGHVVLIRPLSFMLMALAGAVAALALVVYLSVGDYTKRTRASGLLASDKALLTVMAPGRGVVAQKQVREGQVVKTGDVLFVLTVEPAPAEKLADIAATFVKQAQVDKAQRLQDKKTEAHKVDKQIATQQQKLLKSRAEVARLREASKEGQLSDPLILQQLDDVLEQRSRLQTLENTRSRLAKDVTALQGEVAQTQTVLPQPQATPPPVLVRSPADGTITAVMAEQGMAVGNSALFTMTPASTRLEAQLYLPGRQAARVVPGQKVQLQYRMAPTQAFSRHEGTVIDVSLAPVAAQELPQSLTGRGSPGQVDAPPDAPHRIRVSLARQTMTVQGQTQALSAGMQVEADILQGSQRLLEWAFEPRFGTKGKS
ncbi:MAG: HlyD family efflux transporter periplasmic adaptor subunit [Cytophagales bacterium]|nr:HlyD family efflux transporter periplasmic adaptor subunit [Rhizobacter sp.]